MTKETKKAETPQAKPEKAPQTTERSKPKIWERSYHGEEASVAGGYSRSARNKPTQEATLLSKVLLGIIVLAVLVPIVFWIWMSTSNNKAKVTPRTADNVVISRNAESKTSTESSSSKKESSNSSESESSNIARQIVPASQQASRTSVAEPTPTQPEPTYTEPTYTEPAYTEPTPSGGTYVVQAGDSWYAIAGRMGVDVYALMQANGASVDTAIFPGQTIYLP